MKVSVTYYSHGRNTERFVNDRLVPALQGRDFDVILNRVFADGPSRPLSRVEIDGQEADVDAIFATSAYHLLVSPVYRSATEYGSSQVHPEAIQPLLSKNLELYHPSSFYCSARAFDGYVAAGNLNFGSDCFGGKYFPPFGAEVLSTLDNAGSQGVANDIAAKIEATIEARAFTF